MLATGDIRNYQIVVGGLQMINLPISYVLLRLGFIPETVLIVAICISQCCLAARLYMLRHMIGLSVRQYLSRVYFNVLLVTVLSAIIPCVVFYHLNETFVNVMFICVVSVICTCIVIYYIGCNNQERQFILSKVKTVRSKLKK
jgi:small-conductance mechanosensitive channel